MNKYKVLVFGSSGLVGQSLVKTLNSSKKVSEVFASTRKDADLHNPYDINNLIEKFEPDYVVNCAAKVGGIHANNTYRAEFLLDNLKKY